VVRDQLPAPVLLYPHYGKASVVGDCLVFILPIHCLAASLYRRISINAHSNIIGGYGLKFQIT